MNSSTIYYLIYTFSSIFLSIKFGRNRNIGIVWSIFFSIFCPLISIGIIFLSKKKSSPHNPPSLIKWGLIGLAFLVLSQIGGYPGGIYESIGALTLPVTVFIYKFSDEAIGYASGTNLVTIFPLYALLRNFTLKYLP